MQVCQTELLVLFSDLNTCSHKCQMLRCLTFREELTALEKIRELNNRFNSTGDVVDRPIPGQQRLFKELREWQRYWLLGETNGALELSMTSFLGPVPKAFGVKSRYGLKPRRSYWGTRFDTIKMAKTTKNGAKFCLLMSGGSASLPATDVCQCSDQLVRDTARIAY